MDIFGMLYGLSVIGDLILLGMLIAFLLVRRRNVELAWKLRITNAVITVGVIAIALFLEVEFESADIYDDIFTIAPSCVAILVLVIQFNIRLDGKDFLEQNH